MFDLTKKTKADYLVLFMALFSISIHLLVMNNLEYHRDELLYFSLGEHLSCGYATVPPMIGWLAWLMQSLFGYSLFAVRLLPAIMSGVLIILTAAITRELGGSSYSRVLAAAGILISGFVLRSYSLFMPVFVDIIFWTLIIYLVLKYINSQSGRYLVLLGIVAGFSLLNKYLIVLLFLGFALVVPFTSYRDIIKNRKFWTGMLAGLVIFLPNLIWQIVHGIPVLNHMAELSRTQLSHVNRFSFLTDQLMMPSWASFLTISALFYFFLEKNARKYRFLAIVVLLVVVILFMLHGKSYYTIGIFPFLIAAGAVSYELQIRKVWLRIAFPVLLILVTIPVIPLALPVYKSGGLVKYFSVLEKKYGIVIGRTFEDGSVHSLPQDYADMIGWEELTAITDKAYNMIADKKASFIYGENYGYAGAITIIGRKYGLPAAVSFNESFRYWIPQKFDPDITSLIYINGKLGDDVRDLFENITLVGRISNPDSREFGTAVYLCQNPRTSFNEFWKIRLEILNTQP